ncbi:LuxR family transcriptional regulator [Streptomyces chrestomyceticus JCM 4735]|uniref:LuxR family transcriptional regulator n=1 Tax=Streptomyces chrestomyceticus JCM 4735 TaxID=1306181 RepID=A0A7U9KPC3_9ACTN|nr:LuxR family transcriptional regulator [Streptomyces chrestomyceticus]GCD32954.1 LuxR family transcriptional regulator [Streptomyces chrestomyceticus JCM 4735]
MPLTGREAELARLDGLIGRAGGGVPVIVAVRGERGVGKSALLEAVADRAADAGFRVGTAAGGPAVRDSLFAAARQALGRPDDGTDTLDGYVARGRDVMARTPLALCVDDLMDVDASSATWLVALASLDRPVPLLIVAAAGEDPGSGRTAGAAELLARAEHLELTGLPEAGIAEFAARHCGLTLDAAAAAVCHELTGGNPGLLLAHLAGRPGPAVTARELRGAAGPEALRCTRRWLDDLPRPALAMARAVAVLGDSAEVAHAAALAELPVPDALHAIDTLVARQVLANRVPPAFRHPLLGTAVLAGMPVGSRIAAHLKVARFLRDEQWGAERIAQQLAAAGPTGLDWAVEPLRAAARKLLHEGRAEEASRYLRCVLRDRLPADVRSAVRRELAEAETFVDPDLALSELDTLLRESEDPEVCAELALDVAGMLIDRARPADAASVLDETAERIGAGHPAAVRRLTLRKASVSLLDAAGPSAEARRLADAGPDGDADAPERAGGGRSRELANLRAAIAADRGTDREAALAPAREALSGAEGGDLGRLWQSCATLIRADELVEARAHCWRTGRLSRAMSGRRAGLAADIFRARICRVAGDLPGAVAILRPVVEEIGPGSAALPIVAGFAVAGLVEALAQLGDQDEAAALLAAHGVAGHGPDDDLHGRYEGPYLLAARAALWRLRGEPGRAAGDLLAAGRQLVRRGAVSPAVLPWRSRAALALAADGATDRAETLAREELEAARRWGTPRTIGVARHALAMTRSGERRLMLLTEAVRHLEASPARLELAVARADLGAALRAAGRTAEADRECAAALALAGECGATPLARRLRAAPEPVPAHDKPVRTHPLLTPQELKIAGLARSGHTNRQISQMLFLTMRTVEFHLSGVYRKLGITGRQGLAAAIPAEPSAEPPEDQARPAAQPADGRTRPTGPAPCSCSRTLPPGQPCADTLVRSSRWHDGPRSAELRPSPSR